MKVDVLNKTITPTDAYEVFDVWADPTSANLESGSYLCANFAAQRYAGVKYDAAKEWSLVFTKPCYQELFDSLNDAYDEYVEFTFLAGQDDADTEGRAIRSDDNPILRVARAFGSKPDAFQLIVDEDDDGMLYVELTNANKDRFTFTILDDYEMFWAFKRWRDANWRKQHQAALKASADKLLSNV